MSVDDITEGLNNIMKRDAMVAGTEFLPDTQPYAKDDVVQRILAKKKGGATKIEFEPMTDEELQTQTAGAQELPQLQFKLGGTKPDPIRVPQPEPMMFGDETPPTLASPKATLPSQGIAVENLRVNVPNLTQLAMARGEKVSGGKMTRKNTTTGGDIVTVLLTIRNQVKLYHWQTKSYADHKATDDLTAALDLAIDTFVEVYMGKYGRPRVTKAMKLHNFSANMAREFVTKQTVYLLNVLPRKLKKTDTDLLNIRDEILAELNKIRYLFTLA